MSAHFDAAAHTAIMMASLHHRASSRWLVGSAAGSCRCLMVLLWTAISLTSGFKSPHHKRGPFYCALMATRRTCDGVGLHACGGAVTESSDAWACSDVLSACFPSTSRLTHFMNLKAPQAFANVFFDPSGAAVVGTVVETPRAPRSLACVQIIPATLREPALDAMAGDAAHEFRRQQQGSAPPHVFFVQSVAVRPEARRRGLGSELMQWAEAQAVRMAAERTDRRDAQGPLPLVELWLVVDADETPALNLHRGCGFESISSVPAFGNNLVLRKKVDVASDGVQGGGGERRGPGTAGMPGGARTTSATDVNAATDVTASTTDFTNAAVARPGPSISALLRELGAQSVVALVSCIGISLLLAPFGGRGLGELFFSGGVLGVLRAVPFGIAAGLGSEALRRLVTNSEASQNGGRGGGAWSFLDLNEDFVAECRKDESLRAQKAVVARVAGWGRSGASSTATSASTFLPAIFRVEAAVLALWCTAVALSEEAYYRGFLQSGMASLFGSAGAAIGGNWGSTTNGLAGAGDILALVLASSIFGAVHTLWVDDMIPLQTVDDGEAALAENGEVQRQQKLEWLLETGAWGMLYGAVFWASGYHLAAPVAAHASQNLWWNLEDMRGMAKATTAELSELFPPSEEEELYEEAD